MTYEKRISISYAEIDDFIRYFENNCRFYNWHNLREQIGALDT